jgi:LPS sulfotransferase NodH
MTSSAENLEAKLRQMQPLIILGMHRSGTSLTVRLLRDLGIHMGSRLSRDAEAIHFQKINRRIYRSAGSNWGVIDGLLESMESAQFVETNTERALQALFPGRTLLNSRKGISDFFGEPLWDQVSSGEPIWWGWKDPRTTLTFPVWLRVFPHARFLHVLRNGIDVAISMHRRSIKQSKKIWKRLFPLDYIPETLDFDYCFRLWEKHIAYLDKNRALIPANQFLEIRYEDLLTNPHPMMQSIAEFMAYPLDEKPLEAVYKQIDTSRLFDRSYAKPYWDHIRSLGNSRWMRKYDYSYQVQMDQ